MRTNILRKYATSLLIGHYRTSYSVRINNPGHKVIIRYEEWQVINIIENDSY